MSFRLTLTLMLAIFCLAVPAWADFQAGMTAHDSEDYAAAMREWQPLAQQGDAQAQYHVGLLYHKGRGVPQDDAQARKWYAKAAAQGLAKAQFSLGTLYFNGEGGPKDYQQALKWFRLLANKGEALAQTKLGIMYDDGEGVPKDKVKAYMWISLAATNGDKSAPMLRDILAKGMTEAQINKAKKLASEWKPEGQ